MEQWVAQGLVDYSLKEEKIPVDRDDVRSIVRILYIMSFGGWIWLVRNRTAHNKHDNGCSGAWLIMEILSYHLSIGLHNSLICTSGIWGQFPVFSYPEFLRTQHRSDCSLLAAKWQVFSFLNFLRAHWLTLEGCNR